MIQSDLQTKLMHSIAVLIPFAEHAQELKLIHTSLSEVVIPKQDYTNVLLLILRLVNEQQDIVKNPNDHELKSLCLECLEKTKPTPYFGVRPNL